MLEKKDVDARNKCGHDGCRRPIRKATSAGRFTDYPARTISRCGRHPINDNRSSSAPQCVVNDVFSAPLMSSSPPVPLPFKLMRLSP